MDGIVTMEFWHWLILGVVFLVLEIFAPGAIFMWFGFSGLLTGTVVWLFPGMSMGLQFLLFAVAAILSILAWKILRQKNPGPESPDPELNNRLSGFIGQEHVLQTPIKDGRGRIHLGDGTWTILGSDLPAGSRVKIISVKGIQFNVESVASD